MGFVPVTPEQTAEEGLITALQYALRHWQYHEQLYMQQPSIGALLQLRSAVTLIQHTRLLYADVYAVLTPVDWETDLAWLVEQLSWLDEALVLQRMQFEYRQMLKMRRARVSWPVRSSVMNSCCRQRNRRRPCYCQFTIVRRY
jgi:triphosphatase